MNNDIAANMDNTNRLKVVIGHVIDGIITITDKGCDQYEPKPIQFASLLKKINAPLEGKT